VAGHRGILISALVAVAGAQVVDDQAFAVALAVSLAMAGLDVAAADVVALPHDAETHAIDRRLGRRTVSDVMREDVATVLPTESAYRARLVMVTPVATVRADAPVAEAIASMVDLGHQTFPVVDADDRLVGVVSRAELIAVLHRLLVSTRNS
jgi:CBS domain-containing membrane protein